MPSKREIEAAIAAHNATDPEALLPPEAARLLSVMFRRSSKYQRSEAQLAAETSDTKRVVSRLLRILVEAGFLSREPQSGRGPNTYRLHLPPRRQP